jgi:hypothetical protein
VRLETSVTPRTGHMTKAATGSYLANPTRSPRKDLALSHLPGAPAGVLDRRSLLRSRKRPRPPPTPAEKRFLEKIGSYREERRRPFSPLLLARLSKADPGPPPFSSINSTPTALNAVGLLSGARSGCPRPPCDQYLFRICRFLRRSPGPPPFSSMNSIPPASKAR